MLLTTVCVSLLVLWQVPLLQGSYLRDAKLPGVSISGECVPETKLRRVNTRYMREMTGQTIITHEQLTLLENIGQGEFGIVYKANLTSGATHAATNRVAAVKTLKGYFDQTEIDIIMEESLKMRKFKHPHVMSLIGVCLNAGPVIPYMAKGSLLSYLKKGRSRLVLKEDADEDSICEVRKRLTVMCFQIADGMEYLAKEKFTFHL